MANLEQFFLKSRRGRGVSMTTRRTNKNTLRFIMSKTVEATTPDEMEEALALPSTRALIEDFLSNDPTTVNPNGGGIGLFFHCVGGTMDGQQVEFIVPPTGNSLERFLTFMMDCRAGGGRIAFGPSPRLASAAVNGGGGGGDIEMITFVCMLPGGGQGGDFGVPIPPSPTDLARLADFVADCRARGGSIRVMVTRAGGPR